MRLRMPRTPQGARGKPRQCLGSALVDPERIALQRHFLNYCHAHAHNPGQHTTHESAEDEVAMNTTRSTRIAAASAAVVTGLMMWAATPALADQVVAPGTYDSLPPGATDCSPRADGSALPSECTQAPGDGSDSDSFDFSRFPGIEITPGVARTATTFDLGPIIAALGPYASMAIFYVDFGDGTGFGNSGDLKSLGSFPTSHVYVNPGDYTVAGFANVNGKTESTYRMVTIAPATEAPAAATETKGWQTTSAPAATSVISVLAEDQRSALAVGTAVSKIAERSSKAASRTAGKAPRVTINKGQTTLVNIPRLPAGTTVTSRVKIGTSWTTLPASVVQKNGTLTLPALTFNEAGTHLVQLRLANGTSRYLTLKVVA